MFASWLTFFVCLQPAKRCSRPTLKVDLSTLPIQEDIQKKFQNRRMKFFNVDQTDTEALTKLHSTPASVVFSEHDLWSLVTYNFLTDLVLFRLCQMLKGPNLYIVDPQMLSRLVDFENMRWNTANILKRREELGDNKSWSKRLESGQTLVLLMNMPANVHWLSAHVSLNSEGTNIMLRFYNSMKSLGPAQLRKKTAELITGLLHLLGCDLVSRPVVDSTDTHYDCLQQRGSRNLCAIHCVMRVWLSNTSQDGDDRQVTIEVVDHLREYCLLSIFNADKKSCYELTEEEKHANDFGIGDKD